MAKGPVEMILRSGALDLGELQAIRMRAERATAGPWQFYLEGRNHTCGEDFIRTNGEDICLSGATIADSDFVANARQDIPKLIAEIERLESLVQHLEEKEG